MRPFLVPTRIKAIGRNAMTVATNVETIGRNATTVATNVETIGSNVMTGGEYIYEGGRDWKDRTGW